MAKTKGSSKKQQKRGIDFKKIKRKIGRKLPPPKNTTNTEIKSKAIVLPEQSVASEKAGLAVSKKGLTLKELLQHTSHHNAKVRKVSFSIPSKDALMGMKDLFLKYPEELKLHRYAVIEKLRERISDDDKTVRDNLYQLLKSVILPGCKEDNQGPVISLMMAYIFNAMTHLAIDVRLMAFKFFDLVVQYHPPSFFSYAEKMLQNYEDILRKNQFYLEDKNKLKNALAGLVRCLLLLPSSKEVNLPEKNLPERKILHAFEPDVPTVFAEYSVIIKKLKDLVPVLVNCFQDFLPMLHGSLDAQSFDCMLNILRSIDLAVSFFIHGIQEGHPKLQPLDQCVSSLLLKKLLVVFPLSPMHHLSEKDDDRYVILNIAMTEIFMHLSEWICQPADLLEKFLAFVEYVLLEKSCSNMRSGKAVREKQITSLIPFIPRLVSRVIGNWKPRLLQAFTKAFQDCSPESSVKLACLAAIEEMIISREDLPCADVSDSELFDYQITWIRELPILLVLLGDRHSPSSKAAQVVLHLLLRLGQHSLLYDEMQGLLKEFYSTDQDGGSICYGPFLRLARDSQELSSSKPPLDNACAMLRMLIALDSKPTRLSKQSIFSLSNVLSAYLVDVAHGPLYGAAVCILSLGLSDLDLCEVNGIGFSFLYTFCFTNWDAFEPLLVCSQHRSLFSYAPIHVYDGLKFANEEDGAFIGRGIQDDDDDESMGSIREQKRRYYLLPSFFLFDRNYKLLNLVLNVLGSSINGSSSSLLSGDHFRYAVGNSSRINAIVSVLLWMQRDAKVQQILYLCKEEIDHISQSICALQVDHEGQELFILWDGEGKGEIEEKANSFDGQCGCLGGWECGKDTGFAQKLMKAASIVQSFQSPFSSSPTKSIREDPPPVLDDELAIWQNSPHQFVNTYTRRAAPKSNHGDQRREANKGQESEMLPKSLPKDVFFKPETLTCGKALNKKRNYAQFHLDLGQSDFNLRTCSTCGSKYAPGDEGDEKEHKIFHKNYTNGIQFKVLKSERVVHMPCSEAGRIVLVLDSDPPALRNKVQEVIKMMEIELGGGGFFISFVYLFVSSQRVAGCLVAEPIKEAFKVLTCLVDERSNGATRKGSRSNSTTLRFGEVILRREAMKKVAVVDSIDVLDGNHNGAIVCEEEAVPAICGIRAIWVTPSNRRKRIASQLLDAARSFEFPYGVDVFSLLIFGIPVQQADLRSFCMGFVLEQSQLAFSPPTMSGKALASSYAGTTSFLAYKPKNASS
ncbi:unnamed protein product [Dovyalis caffra]|uniref:Uncharacterized protein n=1 Tax=Dovyalis caffra TaxID=77055 RepID=A0AAV1RZ02_9ROSI|nr:unnamed protein product [Dovyalis caffra]